MRSEGRIFQRGKRWWVAYYAPRDGRSIEHREPAGHAEADAKRLLRRRLQEKAVHSAGVRPFLGPAQERVRVGELLSALERDYEIRKRASLAQLRSHLKHVRKRFGEDRAVSINANRVRDYIAARESEGAKAATINHEVKALSRALRLAVEAGLLAVAPKLPCLSERNARQGFFGRAEFGRVLANLDDGDLRDFCEWFYATGMRPKEIRSLSWSGFDRETWILRLHAKDAKTGHGRVLALEGQLRTIVERRLAVRRLGCDLVFHRDGNPVGDFRKAWAAACIAAGVGRNVTDENGKTHYEGKLLYDLRRTAVRNMVRAGVPERVAMEISGHRTRAIFDRYNITSDQDIREAVIRTAAYVETLPTTDSARK